MKFCANFLLCSLTFLYTQTYAFSWWTWEEAQKPSKSFNLSNVLEIEQNLSSKVIGQPYAVKAIADMMTTYHAGLHDSDRPIGVLLFVGSTGVGKTELAKSLAKEITSNSKQFLRFNMAEFSRESGVYRLIGAPWAYRNSEKGGELSNALLENPYSVVLLDEFEKTSRDVALLFLHIFDEGYFTTAKGQHVDCKNCIFIATTNASSITLRNAWRQGLDYDRILSDIEPDLMSTFSPELYGRMQPVLFQNITDISLRQIIHIKLAEVASRLKTKRDIELYFDDSVSDYIFFQCLKDDLNAGARSVLNIIKKDLLAAVAKALVKNHYKNSCRLVVGYDGSAFTVLLQEPELYTNELKN